MSLHDVSVRIIRFSSSEIYHLSSMKTHYTLCGFSTTYTGSKTFSLQEVEELNLRLCVHCRQKYDRSIHGSSDTQGE